MGEVIDCETAHGRLGPSAEGIALEDDRELAAHLANCTACAELAADGARLARLLGAGGEGGLEAQPLSGPAELDGVYSAIQDAISDTTSDTSGDTTSDRRRIEGLRAWAERQRQRPTWQRKLSLAVTAAATIALILGAMVRVDLGLHPLPRLLGALASLLVAAVAAGAVILRPLHRRPRPRSWTGLVAAFTLAVPAVVCSLPAAHRDHPASLLGIGAAVLPRALGCFVFGGAFALLFVAAAWVVERSGLRRRAPAVLTLLGAGALANLLLVLHCPLVEPLHKLTGHATVSLALLFGALGFLSASAQRE